MTYNVFSADMRAQAPWAQILRENVFSLKRRTTRLKGRSSAFFPLSFDSMAALGGFTRSKNGFAYS